VTCSDWTSRIALYLEGDLPPNLVQTLEAHLSRCAACRTFADELRGTQAEFRQLGKEAVDPSSLVRVHTTVLELVRDMERRRRWFDKVSLWLWCGFRWRYAVLGGLTVVSVALGVWRLSSPAVSPVAIDLQVVANQPPLPGAVADVTVAAARTNVSSVHPERPRDGHARGGIAAERVKLEPAKIATNAERKDTVVQILTDDPNIIIYWLIETDKGGF